MLMTVNSDGDQCERQREGFTSQPESTGWVQAQQVSGLRQDDSKPNRQHRQ